MLDPVPGCCGELIEQAGLSGASGTQYEKYRARRNLCLQRPELVSAQSYWEAASRGSRIKVVAPHGVWQRINPSRTGDPFWKGLLNCRPTPHAALRDGS
ncbi:hypothetical protein [Arthrobacter luteolus]|uniref:hypothetical protein n=1 Tax=Arthrobacter luteolus TaxID=98672 RepID=UPI00385048FC